MLPNGGAVPPGPLPGARVPRRCGVPRAELGRRRIQVAGDAIVFDRYLADRRVTPHTGANYRSAYNAVVFWAAQQNLSLSLQHLDNTLRKYLLRLFFDGGPPFDARYALHGTVFVREPPRSNTSLSLSRAALAGFSNLAPEHSRDPMPEKAMFLIAADLLERDGAEGFAAAGALITAFDG